MIVKDLPCKALLIDMEEDAIVLTGTLHGQTKIEVSSDRGWVMLHSSEMMTLSNVIRDHFTNPKDPDADEGSLTDDRD
jgi:hypothetical protein